MVRLDGGGARAKEAEDFSCELEIAVAGGGVEDVNANTRGRVEIARFHRLAPGVGGRLMVERSAGSV